MPSYNSISSLRDDVDKRDEKATVLSLFFLAFTLLASFVLLFKSRTLFELKTKSHYTNETNTCRIKDGDRQRDGQKSRNSANNFLESCSKLSVNFAECGDKMMRGKKKAISVSSCPSLGTFYINISNGSYTSCLGYVELTFAGVTDAYKVEI